MWVKNLMTKLGVGIKKPTLMCFDIQTATYIAYNPMFQEHTKHIEVD